MVSHQRRFHETMKTYWGDVSFYNYKDNDITVDWEATYWGANGVPRLQAVKCMHNAAKTLSIAVQSIELTVGCSM
jgi:hypothetical protein